MAYASTPTSQQRINFPEYMSDNSAKTTHKLCVKGKTFKVQAGGTKRSLVRQCEKDNIVRGPQRKQLNHSKSTTYKQFGKLVRVELKENPDKLKKLFIQFVEDYDIQRVLGQPGNKESEAYLNSIISVSKANIKKAGENHQYDAIYCILNQLSQAQFSHQHLTEIYTVVIPYYCKAGIRDGFWARRVCAIEDRLRTGKTAIDVPLCVALLHGFGTLSEYDQHGVWGSKIYSFVDVCAKQGLVELRLLNVALQALSLAIKNDRELNLLEDLDKIIEFIEANGFKYDLYTVMALIKVYGRVSKFDASHQAINKAHELFSRVEEMEIKVDLYMLNSMISAYACACRHDGAQLWLKRIEVLLRKFETKNIQKTFYTWNSVIAAKANAAQRDSSKKVIESALCDLAQCRASGIEPDEYTYTSLVLGLAFGIDFDGGEPFAEKVLSLYHEYIEKCRYPDTQFLNVALQAMESIIRHELMPIEEAKDLVLQIYGKCRLNCKPKPVGINTIQWMMVVYFRISEALDTPRKKDHFFTKAVSMYELAVTENYYRSEILEITEDDGTSPSRTAMLDLHSNAILKITSATLPSKTAGFILVKIIREIEKSKSIHELTVITGFNQGTVCRDEVERVLPQQSCVKSFARQAKNEGAIDIVFDWAKEL
ncbi:hypothetical protein D5R81_00745 [Parashewanella spongiae]|uniref:Uncharacterized protein n=1 Tax=Parashewanella spongiae TaxID=342950 RepID=A0A3A6UCW4_9GAMM|nr:hypothetical protein [Parashewanella spongiae]MCL1076767.1 hypothetical protein [Parashewanella spongiae]RJY19506.1 hypothetical protein D5R81_00745 [Parashewanella spongiae]